MVSSASKRMEEGRKNSRVWQKREDRYCVLAASCRLAPVLPPGGCLTNHFATIISGILLRRFIDYSLTNDSIPLKHAEGGFLMIQSWSFAMLLV
jgi:hypothetical protein